MAKASDTITLTAVRDIQSVTWYYQLKAGTAAPAKPTVSPPPSPWQTTEPSYTAGDTKYLFVVERTIYTDGTFEYTTPSMSASFEAAKQAYNEAQNAKKVATSYLTEVSNGVFVHPEGTTGNPDDANSVGVRITDAISIIKNGVAHFWAGIKDSVAQVIIGQEGDAQIRVGNSKFQSMNKLGHEIMKVDSSSEERTYPMKINYFKIADFVNGTIDLPWRGNTISKVQGYTLGNDTVGDAISTDSYSLDTQANTLTISTLSDLVSEGYDYVRVTYNCTGSFPSFMFGSETPHIPGPYNAIFGENNRTTGYTCFACGESNRATGTNSVATGLQTRSGNTNTVTAGQGTMATWANQFVIGTYNESPTFNEIFIVGTGADADNRRTGFTINRGGVPSFKNPGGTFDTVFNLIYPVGSIYMSVNSTSPATLFGGTWERIQGRFLLGAGTAPEDSSVTYAANGTGGTKNGSVITHSHGTGNSTKDHFVVSTGVSNDNFGTLESGSGNSYAYYGEASAFGGRTATASTGVAAANRNMPPYLAVYMWKRTA